MGDTTYVCIIMEQDGAPIVGKRERRGVERLDQVQNEEEGLLAGTAYTIRGGQRTPFAGRESAR